MSRIRTMIATAALLSLSSTNAFAAGTISGTVFNDYNSSGTFDTTATLANTGGGTVGIAKDVGVGGVTVTAYDGTGAAVGTATSAADGTYTLTATGTGPYRIEFTTIPSGFKSSFHGADSGTTVQFVANGVSTNVNLGITRPADYCQNNPTLVTSCYSMGNPLSSSNAPFLDVTGRAAIHTFPYASGALTTPGALSPAPTSLATASQVGATWGLAYSRTSRQVFAGAFFKRHAGFGPGEDGVGQSGASTSGDDAGAIYVMNASGGLATTFTVPGATTNAHDTTNYDRDNGNIGWDAVGKTSLGGLAISDDGATLYAMNLENRTLYALDAATGSVNASRQVPLAVPGCPSADDVRPFAVKYHQGSVFVGMVCSAESSQTASDLQAYVYQVDPTSLAFGAVPAFQFALDYPRGNVLSPGPPADWLPWFPTMRTNDSASTGSYPQPILTDIEFDGDNLVIGLRDRSSDQFGWSNLDNPANSTLYAGIPGGDTVRACGSLTGGWTLESNGRCGGLGTATQNTGQGPGNGEYYFADGYSTFHQELSLGGLAQVPGFPDVLSTVFDPRTQYDNLIFDTGVRWWNNSTGGLSKTYMNVDGGANDRLTFGKANGIGDLIALCDAAPIEIGNRVWIDSNGDGVQDPGESNVSGVTVELVDSTDTVVGTTTTSATGLYYFNTTNVTGGVLPNTSYTIRVPGGQTPLAGLVVTSVDGDATTNGDSRDSDGVAGSAGLSSVAITTGPAGSNTHTYDFGYTPTVSLGNQVFADLNDNGVLDPGEVGVSGVDVALYRDADGNGVPDGASVATATTIADGYYLFTGLAPGKYVVQATIPTGYRSSTDIATSAAPNNNTDLDDNGIGAGTGTVRSGTITVTPATEPTGEAATVGISDSTADGSSNLTVDFGMVPRMSLGNQVFSDLNDNGIRDGSEAGVAGVGVALYRDVNGDGVPDGVSIATATTNGTGFYLFTSLAPGKYVVTATIPSGFRSSTDILTTASPDNNADLDDNGIGATSGTVRSGTITLTAGSEPTGEGATTGIADATPDASSNVTVDFGIVDAQTVSLGNVVFEDINDNGKRDSGEPAIAGVSVNLYADANGDGIPDGAAIATATSNARGSYLFTDLIAGKYIVGIVVPTGYRSSTDISTTPNPNNNVDSDDNGLTNTGASVYSGSITLSVGGEPRGEGATPGIADTTPDANSNVTVDFGVTRGRTRVTITKRSNVTEQRVGGLVVYTIAVTNRGNAPARNLQICDTLPAGMSFVSASAGSHKLSGRRCWTISTLSAGATARVRITLRVTVNASPTITNIALVTTGNATRAFSTARVSGVGVRGAGSLGVTG